MSLMNTATDEEREGVRAIQFFLSMTGHKEPEWISLNKWRAFYPDEREYTLHMYNRMQEGGGNAERKEERFQASND